VPVDHARPRCALLARFLEHSMRPLIRLFDPQPSGFRHGFELDPRPKSGCNQVRYD
jgi:hypothetical protein